MFVLGIDTTNRLLRASERGAIFENMIIMETIKRLSYQKGKANCYFYRTQNGVEIDLIVEKSNEMVPYEIKFSKTISKDMAKSLKLFEIDHKVKNGYVLSLNKEKLVLYKNIEAIHFSEVLKAFENF